jgi:hypothetical protein
LRNPHGFPPRKFVLKKDRKNWAIYCDSERYAGFGCDIIVWDESNTNRQSYTQIGTNYHDYYRTYANDVNFHNFFTNTWKFTVEEIEVFEIAN